MAEPLNYDAQKYVREVVQNVAPLLAQQNNLDSELLDVLRAFSKKLDEALTLLKRIEAGVPNTRNAGGTRSESTTEFVRN